MALPTSPIRPPVPDSSTPASPFDQGPGPLRRLLDLAVVKGASDLHIRAGSPPLLRISGELWPVHQSPLGDEDSERLVWECLQNERDRETFRADQECDFALTVAGIGRFRGNAYRTRGTASAVLRHVREEVPSLESLGLPSVVRDLALLSDGLVLLAGSTGSGKTTTLASMVDVINRERRCHILTIEDPIEFLHSDVTSTVSQREIHTDTLGFATALRSGMRQDPDVIMVGEIRDLETMRTALQAAETGHLVLASVHAKGAGDAVNRVIDLFPSGERQQARSSLAATLRGVVCQRLVVRKDANGRVPVIEVLFSTLRVQETILDPEGSTHLNDIITEGEYYGMRTFQQDLVRLVMAGTVAVEDAESATAHISDLTVALKRAGYVDNQERRRA